MIDELEQMERQTTTPRSAPSGWLQLTPAEAAAMLALPFDVRVILYIGRHAKEACPICEFVIGAHSLRYFKVCAASELPKFGLELLELVAAEANS